MAADFVFRKASFGGFNREDVIHYIEMLKAKEKEQNAEIASLQQSLQSANDQCAEQTRAAQAAAEAAAAIREESEQKQSELMETHKQELSYLCDNYEQRIAQMRQEFEDRLAQAQSAQQKSQSMEEKVGTAMLDVRRYSNMMIAEAGARINEIADYSDEVSAQTLDSVTEIGQQIRELSVSINEKFQRMLADNKELQGRLSSFNGSVRTPYDEAAKRLNDLKRRTLIPDEEVDV